MNALEWDEHEARPVGAYWEQIKRTIDWHMLHYLVEEKLDLAEWERVLLKERLEQFALQVEHQLHRAMVARKGKEGLEQVVQELNYGKRDFAQLNEAGLKAIEQQVKKLGRRLASRKGYRYRPAPYGKIDLKRTLKGWAARGGVPSKLKRKTRREEHPELIVLCDISNSMSQYTMFFLLLVWTLQAKHKKIRSFVFVDRLAEVTHLLKGQEALEGLRFIGMAAPCSATGYTDYGRVFADFVEGYLQDLHVKMKLLVLGDGKNNWRDPQVGAFKMMSERVGAVYWLNPRSREQWYDKDSVLDLYRPYCKGIYQCSNLAELQQVSSLLF
ncbi:MAG: VWA domain-containing protein [Clostridia bacterium]|nr:VWA domain-containing protein [Clostridia bacterium]